MARLAFVAVATISAFLLPMNFSSASAEEYKSCDIKGNVSTRGERIYHVPGQKYYDETRISVTHGERWFCSEKEARDAGWRKSRV